MRVRALLDGRLKQRFEQERLAGADGPFALRSRTDRGQGC